MYLLPRAIHHNHGGDHTPDTGSHPVGDTTNANATTTITSSSSTIAYSSSSSPLSSSTRTSTRTYTTYTATPPSPPPMVMYTNSSNPRSLNAGELIGIVVGVLAGLCLSIVVVAWYRHSQKGPMKAKAVPPPFSGPRARMAATQNVPMINIAGPASPARFTAGRPTSPFLDLDPADLEPPPPPYAPGATTGVNAGASASEPASGGVQARNAANRSVV